MPKNQKAFRCLSRLIDTGYDTEKKILALTMDGMLALPGITIAELSQISTLQKCIRTGKVIAYLAGGEEGGPHECQKDDSFR